MKEVQNWKQVVFLFDSKLLVYLLDPRDMKTDVLLFIILNIKYMLFCYEQSLRPSFELF